MKKILPFTPMLTVLLGLAGGLLRSWMFRAGPDSSGLFDPLHPSWILLLALSAGTLALLFFLTRQYIPRAIGTHRAKIALAGSVLAAAGLLIYSIPALQSPLKLVVLSGALGIISAAFLIYGGLQPLLNRPGFSLTHLPVAVFFALNLFLLSRDSSGEPELCRYLPEFGAMLTGMLAGYQRWGFDVGSGSHRRTLFWCLASLYLCLVSIPGSNSLFFTGIALWQLLSVCTMAQPRIRQESTEEII